jgi:hypothetical protein
MGSLALLLAVALVLTPTADVAAAAERAATSTSIPGPPIQTRSVDEPRPAAAEPGAFCATGLCRPAQSSRLTTTLGFGLCVLVAGLLARRRRPLAS